MGDVQKLPDLKKKEKKDYSWGAEAQKTVPKPVQRLKLVVPALKPVQKFAAQAAPRTEEIVPQAKQAPAQAMIKLSNEPAKELEDVMEHVKKMHKNLVGKIGEETAERAITAYIKLTTSYDRLHNYLENKEADVQKLNGMLANFLGSLNSYSIASTRDYNLYRSAHKKGVVEGTMDWAVPVGTGIAALIALRKGKKEGIKGLKSAAAQLKKVSALRAEAKLLEKGIAGYAKLGKKELGPIYQWLVRTGIGTGAVVAGGLAGGTFEYSWDSMFRSMKKGEIRQFFFNQNKIINGMRDELTALQKQNTTDNKALAGQIDAAWLGLDNAQAKMRAAEAAISKGQKAPDFMGDFYKSATAVAVISITLPWIFAGGAAGLKAVSKKMREAEKLRAAEMRKLAKKGKNK
jgi:hypothetical protein